MWRYSRNEAITKHHLPETPKEGEMRNNKWRNKRLIFNHRLRNNELQQRFRLEMVSRKTTGGLKPFLCETSSLILMHLQFTNICSVRKEVFYRIYEALEWNANIILNIVRKQSKELNDDLKPEHKDNRKTGEKQNFIVIPKTDSLSFTLVISIPDRSYSTRSGNIQFSACDSFICLSGFVLLHYFSSCLLWLNENENLFCRQIKWHLDYFLTDIWYATWEKWPYAICDHQRSKYAWASEQSYLGILRSSTYTVVHIDSVSGQRRPISACANA